MMWRMYKIEMNERTNEKENRMIYINIKRDLYVYIYISQTYTGNVVIDKHVLLLFFINHQ